MSFRLPWRATDLMKALLGRVPGAKGHPGTPYDDLDWGSFQALLDDNLRSLQPCGGPDCCAGLTCNWTSAAPTPEPIYYNAVAPSSIGKIYSFGGWTDGIFERDVTWEYHPFLNTWATKAPLPQARHMAMAVHLAGFIYVCGGREPAPTYQYTKTVYRYNPLSDTWTTVAPMIYETGVAAIGAPGNGKIYVAGGSNNFTASPFCQEYTPSTDTWTLRANMPVSLWRCQGATPGNGKFYVLGGQDGTTLLPTDHCLEYNPTTNTWTARAPMPVALSAHMAYSMNGRIYVTGGFNGNLESNTRTFEYTPFLNSWCERASLPSVQGNGGAASVFGRFYVIGGTDESGHLSTNRYLTCSQT